MLLPQPRGWARRRAIRGCCPTRSSTSTRQVWTSISCRRQAVMRLCTMPACFAPNSVQQKFQFFHYAYFAAVGLRNQRRGVRHASSGERTCDKTCRIHRAQRGRNAEAHGGTDVTEKARLHDAERAVPVGDLAPYGRAEHERADVEPGQQPQREETAPAAPRDRASVRVTQGESAAPLRNPTPPNRAASRAKSNPRTPRSEASRGSARLRQNASRVRHLPAGSAGGLTRTLDPPGRQRFLTYARR